VTSPVSARGQVIFAAGCGILVYVIRTWAGYPEGVAFAVMIMNACTPVIDHWVRPRIYGRDRKGEPLDCGSPLPEGDGDKVRLRRRSLRSSPEKAR
jgi:electron transport complex protein RnfD